MSQIVPMESGPDCAKASSKKGVPEVWIDQAEREFSKSSVDTQSTVDSQSKSLVNVKASVRSLRSQRSVILEKVNVTRVKWTLVLLSFLATVLNVFFLRLFFGMSTYFAALLFGLAGVLKPYMHLLPWSLAYPDHLTSGQFRNFCAALSAVYVILTVLRYLMWPEDNPAFEAKVSTEAWQEARENVVSSACMFLQVLSGIGGMLWLPILVYRRAVTERHSTCLYGAGFVNSGLAMVIVFLDITGTAHVYKLGILGLVPWLFYLYWDRGKNLAKDWGYLHILTYFFHVLPIGLGAVTFDIMMALKGSGVGQLIVFMWYHVNMMLFIEMAIVTAKRAVGKDPRKYIPLIFPFVFAYDVFGDFCFLGAPLDSWYFWAMVVFEILIVLFHDSGWINDFSLILTCTKTQDHSPEEKLELLHEQLACAELYTMCELWGIFILLLGVFCEFVFEAAGIGTHSLLAYVEESQKGRLKILLKFTILAVVITLTCRAGHKILLYKIRKAMAPSKEASQDAKAKHGDEIQMAKTDSLSSLDHAEHEHHKSELMWKEQFTFFLAVVLYEGAIAFWNVAFVNWRRKWILAAE